MNRISLSAEKYEQLFGSPPDAGVGPDPELMAVLRHVIFGEVFQIGALDDRTRELITVVVLVTSQTLSQLRSHTAAALNVGVSTIEIQIREAVYQCAPFVGFARRSTASIINEVFAERGIDLPLPARASFGVDVRSWRRPATFGRRALVEGSVVGGIFSDAVAKASTGPTSARWGFASTDHARLRRACVRGCEVAG